MRTNDARHTQHTRTHERHATPHTSPHSATAAAQPPPAPHSTHTHLHVHGMGFIELLLRLGLSRCRCCDLSLGSSFLGCLGLLLLAIAAHADSNTTDAPPELPCAADHRYTRPATPTGHLRCQRCARSLTAHSSSVVLDAEGADSCGCQNFFPIQTHICVY